MPSPPVRCRLPWCRRSRPKNRRRPRAPRRRRWPRFGESAPFGLRGGRFGVRGRASDVLLVMCRAGRVGRADGRLGCRQSIGHRSGIWARPPGGRVQFWRGSQTVRSPDRTSGGVAPSSRHCNEFVVQVDVGSSQRAAAPRRRDRVEMCVGGDSIRSSEGPRRLDGLVRSA